MFIFVIVGGSFVWKRIFSCLFIYVLPFEIQLSVRPGFLTSYVLGFVKLHCVNIFLINNGLQNTAQKTKDWATRTPLKTGSEFGCSGMVGSSCSSSETCRVTNPAISHEWGKPDCDYDKQNISVVICDTDIPQWLTRSGDFKTFEAMTSTEPLGTLNSVVKINPL